MRLVFDRGGRLWIWAEDGGSQRLLCASTDEPPDGVAFDRFDEHGVELHVEAALTHRPTLTIGVGYLPWPLQRLVVSNGRLAG